MSAFTPEEFAALSAFRDQWPRERLRKCRYSSWEDVLYVAWSQDWREQWGTLRALRNSPRFASMVAIVAAFKRESAQRAREAAQA